MLFSRTVNGLTNIWSYSLRDRSLTQITFGTGVDFSPMPDPGGKGIYYLNGRFSGGLAAYHVRAKESTDIESKDAGQPIISRDGKRVMYTTSPTAGKVELWVSDINGGNKVKIASVETQEGDVLTLNWAPDNSHLSFSQGSKLYIVGADGGGLRQLPSMGGMSISNAVWSPDQKSVYVSTVESPAPASAHTIWRWSDGSNPLRWHRIRLFTRSFHHRLFPCGRPHRPISSGPELNALFGQRLGLGFPHALERAHPDIPILKEAKAEYAKL